MRSSRLLLGAVVAVLGLGGAARGRRVYAIEGGVSPGLSFSGAIEALDVR
jgi:hypothetical protein